MWLEQGRCCSIWFLDIAGTQLEEQLANVAIIQNYPPENSHWHDPWKKSLPKQERIVSQPPIFRVLHSVLECVAQVFVSRWLYAMDFFLPHHLAHLHLCWDLRKSVIRLISDRCDHVVYWSWFMMIVFIYTAELELRMPVWETQRGKRPRLIWLFSWSHLIYRVSVT